MTKKVIKWGIIGCGNVTEVKSGPAFSQVPNSQLVAVMRSGIQPFFQTNDLRIFKH